MKIPISNRKITEELAKKLKAACGEDLLFVIFGDLETDSRYAERLLACSKDTLFTLDADAKLITRAPFADLSEVSAKRMYGNSVLSAVTNGEKMVLYRCSYAAASEVSVSSTTTVPPKRSISVQEIRPQPISSAMTRFRVCLMRSIFPAPKFCPTKVE